MNINVRVGTAPTESHGIERPFHKRCGPIAAANYAGHLQTQKRPVVAMAATYPSESMSTRHAHRRGQFILQTTGVTSMMTERGNFVIPPGHGLWIPAGVVHQSRAWGDVEAHTIYVEPDRVPSYPAMCRLIRASSLLEALMNEAVRMPVHYDERGRDGKLVDLLLDEIGRMLFSLSQHLRSTS